MLTFACFLCCSVPLMIYTSPPLRLISAPVCLLMSRRVALPFPIIIPLNSTGISTSSHIPLFTSSCQGNGYSPIENGYSHFFEMLGEKIIRMTSRYIYKNENIYLGLQLTTFSKIILFAHANCSALPLTVNPSSSVLVDQICAPDLCFISCIAYPRLPMTCALKSLGTGTNSLCIASVVLMSP